MSENCYHFESNEWMRYVKEHGLVPHKGRHCQLAGNHSKGVYYSCGMIGAIIMYIGFRKSFAFWKSPDGQKILSKYNEIISNKTVTDKHELDILKAKTLRISQLVTFETIDDYMEPGPFLEIFGLGEEKKEDEENNYPADCITHSSIPPEQLRVLALMSKDDNSVLTDIKNIIFYFFSQISEDEFIQLNAQREQSLPTQLLQDILKYKSEHNQKINYLAEKFHLVHITIDEYISNYMLKPFSTSHILPDLKETLLNPKLVEEFRSDLPSAQPLLDK